MISSKKIIEKAIYPNQYGWMLFLFILLLLPNLSVLCFCSELSLFKRIASLVFAVLIWLLPALFLKARSYFLLAGLFVLAAPLEIGSAFLNKTPLTEGLVSAIFHTDRAEASELLATFYGFIPFILLVWGSYYWVVFKKIRNVPLFRPAGKYLFVALFLLFNLGIWGSMYYLTTQHKQDRWGIINATNDSFWKKYQIVYPGNLLYACYRIGETQRQIARMQSRLQDFRFGAKQADSIQVPEIYLLLIGESARFDHFGINGYERQTTPNLSRLPNLLSYTNVYATANLTEYVLSHIISRSTPQEPKRLYQEKALPDAFQEAGFATCWIANQGDNYPFIQRIAQDADWHHFLKSASYSSASYDENLLPFLDQALAQKKNKQFIVLHTQGCHFQYDKRYPEAYNRFKPNLAQQTLLDGSEDCKRRLVNSYDNCILYTDHIISQVIERLRQTGAVSALVYLSDHAESLYDEPERNVLHGNTLPAKKELHIPLFVWLSDAYRQTYPEKAALLAQNRDKRLSSTNVFDTLLDIANIHYPDETLEQSFASPLFKEESSRCLLTPEQRIIAKKEYEDD